MRPLFRQNKRTSVPSSTSASRLATVAIAFLFWTSGSLAEGPRRRCASGALERIYSVLLTRALQQSAHPLIAADVHAVFRELVARRNAPNATIQYGITHPELLLSQENYSFIVELIRQHYGRFQNSDFIEYIERAIRRARLRYRGRLIDEALRILLIEVQAIPNEWEAQHEVRDLYGDTGRQRRRPPHRTHNESTLFRDINASEFDRDRPNIRITTLDRDFVLIDSLDQRFIRSEYNIGEGNALGNSVAFLRAAGAQLGERFGYRLLTIRRLRAPRPRIVNEAIRTFNRLLPPTNRIPFEVAEVAGHASMANYVRNFADFGRLVFASRGLFLVHDLAFHLGGIFIPPRFVEHARKTMQIFLRFKEFVERQDPALLGNPEVQGIFEDELSSIAVRIDRGTGNFGANVGEAILLSRNGLSAARSRWDFNYQEVFNTLAGRGQSPLQILRNFINGQYITEQTSTYEAGSDLRPRLSSSHQQRLHQLLNQFARSEAARNLNDTLADPGVAAFEAEATERVNQMRRLAEQPQRRRPAR